MSNGTIAAPKKPTAVAPAATEKDKVRRPYNERSDFELAATFDRMFRRMPATRAIRLAEMVLSAQRGRMADAQPAPSSTGKDVAAESGRACP